MVEAKADKDKRGKKVPLDQQRKQVAEKYARRPEDISFKPSQGTMTPVELHTWTPEGASVEEQSRVQGLRDNPPKDLFEDDTAALDDTSFVDRDLASADKERDDRAQALHDRVALRDRIVQSRMAGREGQAQQSGGSSGYPGRGTGDPTLSMNEGGGRDPYEYKYEDGAYRIVGVNLDQLPPEKRAAAQSAIGVRIMPGTGGFDTLETRRSRASGRPTSVVEFGDVELLDTPAKEEEPFVTGDPTIDPDRLSDSEFQARYGFSREGAGERGPVSPTSVVEFGDVELLDTPTKERGPAPPASVVEFGDVELLDTPTKGEEPFVTGDPTVDPSRPSASEFRERYGFSREGGPEDISLRPSRPTLTPIFTGDPTVDPSRLSASEFRERYGFSREEAAASQLGEPSVSPTFDIDRPGDLSANIPERYGFSRRGASVTGDPTIDPSKLSDSEFRERYGFSRREAAVSQLGEPSVSATFDIDQPGDLSANIPERLPRPNDTDKTGDYLQGVARRAIGRGRNPLMYGDDPLLDEETPPTLPPGFGAPGTNPATSESPESIRKRPDESRLVQSLTPRRLSTRWMGMPVVEIDGQLYVDRGVSLGYSDPLPLETQNAIRDQEAAQQSLI
mgnify:CR=1 FL=1